MAKIIKLTESDLRRIVKKVIKEQRSSLKEAVPAIAVAAAGAATGLAGLAIAIVNGPGSSDQKVKQFVDLCKSSKVQITANANQIADKIRDAVQGIGTDEQAIYSIFKANANPFLPIRTMNEFCSVVKSYETSYDASLFDDLDGDIDSESEWVLIFRPLRDIALRDQQNQTQPKPQGATNATVQAAKNTPQPTKGGPRPTTAQNPTSRMPVR